MKEEPGIPKREAEKTKETIGGIEIEMTEEIEKIEGVRTRKRKGETEEKKMKDNNETKGDIEMIEEIERIQRKIEI